MGKSSRLRGVWLSKANPKDRRAPYGRDEPSAPAYDRGHDGPQSVAGDATILRPRGLEVQPIFWPFSGSAGSGRRPGLPSPSGFDRDLLAGAEPDGLRAAVLL